MPCCSDIKKEEYLNGKFKTNNFVPSNQLALLKQARVALWTSLHEFKIRNLTVKKFVYYYLDNQTVESRRKMLGDYELIFKINKNFREFDKRSDRINSLHSLVSNSKLVTSNFENVCLINSIVEDSEVKLENNIAFFNCHFKNCKLEFGRNSILNDVLLVMLLF